MPVFVVEEYAYTWQDAEARSVPIFTVDGRKFVFPDFEEMELYEMCECVYHVLGSSGVYDFLDLYTVDAIEWTWCDACDTDVPVEIDTDICLVCGSGVTKIETVDESVPIC